MAKREIMENNPIERSGPSRAISLACAGLLLFGQLHVAVAAPLSLAQIPLFISTPLKSNVLQILDNSNSMDEAPSGEAVGSASAFSKSEIARGVARGLLTTYQTKINLGLMTYAQTNVGAAFLHRSPYDVSYDPANYDAAFQGNRASLTKRFRLANPASPNDFIYYNVDLPFYSSVNQGTAFCYSNTAHAFNNGENPGTGTGDGGPWDTYRCYGTKTGSSDTLPAMDGTGAAAAGYLGGSNNYSFFPTDSDLAQGILDFGRFMAWMPIGRAWLSNQSPGYGFLNVPVGPIDAPQTTRLNTALACNVPGAAAPCTNTGIRNAGLTPIEGTLLTARNYFAGTVLSAAEGGPAATPPLSCNKNFAVLLTDGLPSNDRNGAVVTNPVAGLAAAANAATQLRASGVETYVVGFALPFGTDPTALDQIAAAGGTVAAYNASDQASLSSAFDSIFKDILAKSGSAAAVAANSSSLLTGAALFQAKFDASDWSGQLLRYNLKDDGSIESSPAWIAGSAQPPQPGYYKPLPGASSRTILTYKPSNHSAIAFRWPTAPTSPTSMELDTAQSGAIGSANVLNYLRGDETNEGPLAPALRKRVSGKMGDVVDSSPVYVGAPSAGYADTIESAAPYSTFRQNNLTRTPIVYVGANDGYLHGFDATTGQEKIAYAPSIVVPQMAQLSSQGYAHRNFVDGSPAIGDVYFGGAWHTMLVGGLNAGGQGMYALDVTDPSSFSEGNATSIVKWEFGDHDDPATGSIVEGDPDLGYTYSQPVIAKMHNGKWVAIFGNGYNNTTADGNPSLSGSGVLYIIDIENGNLIRKFDTKSGTPATPNGLASPAATDIDGDSVIDYIYAGDLNGNMWKFDVTDSDAYNWKIAYGTLTGPEPLFVATDDNSVAQPITSRPDVGTHPGIPGALMVYFGTGKYVELADASPINQQTQTFYAISDRGARNNSSRDQSRSTGKLLKQKIIQETTLNGATWRLSENNTINGPEWDRGTNTSNDKYGGWYMDLYNTESNSTANLGERVVANPILRNGRVIFDTLVPTGDVCNPGGVGWLMELDAVDGSRLPYTPFDVDGNGKFTADDYILSLYEPGAKKVPVSGRKLLGGFAGTPTIINQNTEKQHKYLSKSSGALEQVEEKGGAVSGRISWRELRKE
jgi:type IV pilus assembly protein PilY1